MKADGERGRGAGRRQVTAGSRSLLLLWLMRGKGVGAQALAGGSSSTAVLTAVVTTSVEEKM